MTKKILTVVAWLIMWLTAVLAGSQMVSADVCPKGQDVCYEGIHDTRLVGCTNPTTYTTGAPFTITPEDRVEIYASTVDKSSSPEATLMMQGGCQDMLLDLTVFSPGDTIYLYGKTFEVITLNDGSTIEAVNGFGDTVPLAYAPLPLPTGPTPQ